MSHKRASCSKLALNALGLLIVGIVGGVAMVCLVVGSIFLYGVIFDPQGAVGHGDPMAGVGFLYQLLTWCSLSGAVLAIAAVVVVSRIRHQRNR
ncbi:hypothetical protein CA54_05430 [Symmachiella macrocystis]|uniref:Uncharacterized protein n=1 Tax=Symmachiella macrocystis TaxID=2527985 RepID=A0A5C6BMK2_9PLAN|nr:hypothetical protein CA54_05430 [Symmachiella macrocystis]